jgi:hypothetical protein
MSQINTRYLTLTNKPYPSISEITTLKNKLICEYDSDLINPNRIFSNNVATFQLPAIFHSFPNHKFIKVNTASVSYIKWENGQNYITEHPNQPTSATLHSNITDYHEYNIVNTTDYGVGSENYTTPPDYVMMCNSFTIPKIYHIGANSKVNTTNGEMRFEFKDFMGKNIPLIEYKYDVENKLSSMFFLLFKIELELLTHG